ncbi:MAG TPA: outer membrane beta-barrel protein, partial [Catalimonadaceae bacterium]|nr:outer membrane beta-barrel protein [Catalimonadaceae bacterium]
MKSFTRWLALVFLFHAIPFSFAQTPTDSLFIQQIRRLGQIEDSLRVLKISIDRVNRDLALTGTRLISAESEGEERKLSFGGYVSTYFASYSDTSGGNGYQKFPTISPRNNAFGLDMALISTRYVSQSLRGTITLHLGDIPSSAWSATYNLVQEANLGFKLGKKWWLDGGFFRTHIGLESIQPRENICQSIALVTYFEPYFLSGAKLSFLASDQVTAQVQILNSFNGFVGQNVRK